MSDKHEPFLEWVAQWEANLPTVELEAVVSEPARVALVSVDLVKGFCYEGPLASPRVAGIVPAVVRSLPAGLRSGGPPFPPNAGHPRPRRGRVRRVPAPLYRRHLGERDDR